MATKITRTITTTVVDIAYVDVDETGNHAMREDTLTLDGEFSDYAKLEKAVHKVRPDAKILKDSIKTDTALYAMSIEDFIANAECIDRI